jgi:hypothetical protein
VSKDTKDERGPTDDPNVEAETILLFIHPGSFAVPCCSLRGLTSEQKDVSGRHAR